MQLSTNWDKVTEEGNIASVSPEGFHLILTPRTVHLVALVVSRWAYKKGQICIMLQIYVAVMGRLSPTEVSVLFLGHTCGAAFKVLALSRP